MRNKVYRTKRELTLAVATVGGYKEVVLPTGSILTYNAEFGVYSHLITALWFRVDTVETNNVDFEEVVK